MNFAGCQLNSHHTGGRAVLDQHIQHLELVKKIDVVLDALLVKCLQDHMPGAIGGITGPRHRFAGDIIGVPAKRPLGDAPICGAREGQAHMFQFINRLHCLLAHKLDGILVAEVIAAFDRIESMPFGMILFDISQGRPYPALGGAGMRTAWIQLAEHSRAGCAGGIQSRHQTSAPTSHDNYIKLMVVAHKSSSLALDG